MRGADRRTVPERVVFEEAVLKQGTAVDYSSYQKVPFQDSMYIPVHWSVLLNLGEPLLNLHLNEVGEV